MTAPTTAQQNTLALMQALGFTGDELLLNREGQHSARQAARITQEYKARSSYSFFQIAIAVVGMFIAGFLISLRRPFLLRSFGPGAVIAVIVTGVILFLIILLVFSLIRRGRTRQGRWRVRRVTGRAQVQVSGSASRPGAIVRIRRTRFAVPDVVRGAFMPGRPYSIYYVGGRRGGLLLSAEAMEDGSRS